MRTEGRATAASMIVFVLASSAAAVPPYFHYRVWGVNNYAPWPVLTLDVGADHSAWTAAVNTYIAPTPACYDHLGDDGDFCYNPSGTPTQVWNYYRFVTAMSPGKLTYPNTWPSVNQYDVGVIHAHGSGVEALDLGAALGPNCGDPAWPALGYNPANELFGKDVDGYGCLKWLWAHSCDWFRIGWTWPVKYWSVITTNDKGFIPLGHQPSATDISSTTTGGTTVRVSGVTVLTYFVSSVHNGDWFKMRFLTARWPGSNVSAPSELFPFYSYAALGVNCLNTGTIRLYLGAADDVSPIVRRTDNRVLLASITIAPADVGSYKLMNTGTFAALGPGRHGSLYLEFETTSGQPFCEVSQITFWPKSDVQFYDYLNAMGPMMTQVHDFWKTKLNGAHAILGWETPTEAGHDRAMYPRYLENWVGLGFTTAQAYLKSRSDAGIPITEHHPGLLVAASCTGETWNNATNNLAPPVASYMIWSLPEGNFSRYAY